MDYLQKSAIVDMADDKPTFRLTDVMEVAIRSQSNYCIHSEGITTSSYDAEMDEIDFMVEGGAMEVIVDVADDIVSLTTKSLESAKRANETLGHTIAGYEDSSGTYYDSERVVRELEKAAKTDRSNER